MKTFNDFINENEEPMEIDEILSKYPELNTFIKHPIKFNKIKKLASNLELNYSELILNFPEDLKKFKWYINTPRLKRQNGLINTVCQHLLGYEEAGKQSVKEREDFTETDTYINSLYLASQIALGLNV